MVYCIVGAGVLLNILLRIRLTRERGFLPQRINKYTDLFCYPTFHGQKKKKRQCLSMSVSLSDKDDIQAK